MTTVSGSGSRYTPRHTDRLASGGPSSQQSDRNNVPNAEPSGGLSDPVAEAGADASRPVDVAYLAGHVDPHDAGARLAGMVSQILLEIKAAETGGAAASGRNSRPTIDVRHRAQDGSAAGRLSGLEGSTEAGSIVKQLLTVFSVKAEDDPQSQAVGQGVTSGPAELKNEAVDQDAAQADALAIAIQRYKAFSSDDVT